MIKTDKAVIEINNMEFYAFHGCYTEEKIVGNRFVVDFSYVCDVTKAVESDYINDTISYLEVYQLIEKEIMIGSNLLENVAHRALTCVVNNFVNISKATIKISKMTPPLGGDIKSVSLILNYIRD